MSETAANKNENPKGGPGNPFARQVALFRASLVTPEEVIQVKNVLKERALGGDVAAIKLYLQYMIGKPAETVDPDRMGIDEWKKLKELAVASEETEDVLEQCPAEMACELVKMQWPSELERNLREGAEERAQIEAEIEEDERYFEQLERAEAEALKQKTAADQSRPSEAPSPAGHARPASARREAQPAAPNPRPRQRKSPSTNAANGTQQSVESAPSSPGLGERLILALNQRMRERFGIEEALPLSGSPSTNGEKPAMDGQG